MKQQHSGMLNRELYNGLRAAGVSDENAQRIAGEAVKYDFYFTTLDKSINSLRTDMEKSNLALRTDMEKSNLALRSDMERSINASRVDTERTINALRTDTDKSIDALRIDTEKSNTALRSDMEKSILGVLGEVKRLEEKVTVTTGLLLGLNLLILGVVLTGIWSG